MAEMTTGEAVAITLGGAAVIGGVTILATVPSPSRIWVLVAQGITVVGGVAFGLGLLHRLGPRLRLPRRHYAIPDDDIIWLFPRSLSAEIRDRQRERRVDPFPLVDTNGVVVRYRRRDLDPPMTDAQRDKLFAREPAMKSWWYGRSADGEWTRFRLPGGFWITKEDMKGFGDNEDQRHELYQRFPDLLDWFLEGKSF